MDRKLPKDFDRLAAVLVKEASDVEGFLSPREMDFLALLGAVPTAAEGVVLEIGSFKGKSTVILAKAGRLAQPGVVINAVVPMTAPSKTDPDLQGQSSSLDDFQRNIEQQGVAANVRLHQMLSSELAPTWDKPLRLLWIDGDHTYAGTKADFDGFAPHLADKAIVAFHDVLHEFEGGAPVFAESILLSPNFGACGFCGSIGWGQYHADAADAARFSQHKASLFKKLSRVIPFVGLGEGLTWWKKKQYKFHRALVPHGAVNPNEWVDLID